ncbi:2-hydroxycyclohexane-1-carbonyl-CoA dehydrogenase [Actinomycetospora sp. NBRC 106375]|uniref:SDR family NAD(P)-dependent oxidoreductase n=1 Tax=Actinomycetospora sp. NBRC 106375 TaxID=3032207 RepID=UPI0024A07C49|nr:SDR family oxidoreductase [Actinomycetospora sp. NBRC 106375]GLZ48157.1 2-hydroxycyclohexane-1-carbonyl-CoA dehydrogenase [Actinomycetospora sp. NBRC 106375]
MSALAGRVAVVTGGATGIGHAITRRLAADGAAVVVAGLGKEEVDAAVAGLTTPAIGVAGDLAAPGVADRLRDQAVEAFGAVDVLVNNAGGGVIRPTLEHTEETLQATIDNNLWTTLRCCLAFLPAMRARGYGRIVNIGAESVRNGLTDHAVYNAAKGGVHALATGLAREFAGDGITVNTVAPSYTRTDALDAAFAAGRLPERLRTVVDDAVRLIPQGRPAEVDEIAAAVAYLAREDSRFVTGQTLSVNGGSSMS